MLSPRLYPIDTEFSITPQDDWLQMRLLKTVLGNHLLVNNGERWLHLDPLSAAAVARPSDDDLIGLVEDALGTNTERYGEIEGVRDQVFYTSTGVELTVDWSTLSIRQYGRDTQLIDTLYKIHYLQWFGHKQVNITFAVLGLLGLLLLVVFGLMLYLRGRRKTLKR